MFPATRMLGRRPSGVPLALMIALLPPICMGTLAGAPGDVRADVWTSDGARFPLHHLSAPGRGADEREVGSTPATDEAIARALARGTAYLVAQQESDGQWHSHTYGAMHDGLALTPAIAKAVAFAAEHDPRARAACVAAVESLVVAAETLGAAGGDRAGAGPYPVSTAALSVIVLRRAEATLPELDPRRLAAAREAWLTELLRHQLGPSLGWNHGDADFGGWGYSVTPPVRPDSALVELLPFGSDLSSTMLAIAALRMGGDAGDADRRADLAAALDGARHFVLRCQNWSERSEGRDPDGASLDDGGFATTPCRHAQNKAGMAGVDGAGRTRASSYGTATADGLRAMLRLGMALDHPRVEAARRWLEAHFDPRTNPGRFDPQRAHEQNAGRYCWAWSVAHAWQALESAGERQGAARRRAQAAALVHSILDEQRPDGSWSNPNPFMKEDDPLIATVLAMGALGAAARAVWSAP